MKKIISSYVVLCGLLGSSFVLVGMDKKNNNSSFVQKAEKEIKKIDNVLYPVGHKLLEEAKQNPQAIVSALNAVIHKQETTDDVVTTVNRVETVQDSLHDKIQHLGSK